MHIVFITAEYPVLNFSHGGVGTFIRNLSYKMVKDNFKISVIRLSAAKKGQVIIDEGVEVHVIPQSTKPLSFLFNSLKINKAIKEIHKNNKIDIVETPELGLAFIKKTKGISYVIRMHGGHHYFSLAEKRPTEWKKVWQEKKSFSKADHMVAVSKYVAETTRNLLKLDDKTITVIYNPVDTKRFYQSDENKIEKHTIFFAGTIVEKKGIRQLVQSLEYLVDDFPDVKLKIAGRDATLPGSNIPYRPILEEVISDKIRPHVTFLGVLPNFDIPKHIEKANVCCYPSHMEAMPLAWLEVLAMGKIFIGSTTGPGPEAVKDKITGLLANPYSPEDIAAKIRYVFENEVESIAIGKRARQNVMETFDVNILAKKNSSFFRSIK